MKKLTKVLSLVLALALVLMSVNIVTVYANKDFKANVTITSEVEGHTFTAYQIFRGTGTGGITDVGVSDVDEPEITTGADYDPFNPVDNAHILGNIAFAENVVADDLADAFSQYSTSNPNSDFSELYNEKLSGFTGVNRTASFLAKAIDSMKDNARETEALARAFAYYFKEYKGGVSDAGKTQNSRDATGYKFNNLEEGYYLFTDNIEDSLSHPDAKPSAAILALIGGQNGTPKEVTISPKNEQTHFDKKLNSTSDKAFSVGEYVPFKLEVTIPSDVRLYKKYNIVIEDTLTNMTADESELKGSEDWTKGGLKVYYDGDTSVSSSDLKKHFEITVDGNVINIKHLENDDYGTSSHWDGHAGKTIVFEYSAKLTSSALGSTVTKNSAELTFSNDPSVEGSTDKITKEVPVYTHNLIINKTNSTGPLIGARFVITEWNGIEFAPLSDGITVPKNNGTESTFVWKGLGDGWYKITEQAPTGYNNWSTTEDSKIIHVQTTLDATNKITGVTVTTYDYSSGFSGTLSGGEDEDHKFTWKEDTSNGSSYGVPDDKSMAIVADIENEKGVNLPETGGMGTKIFYTLGGILVVGAVVLLVVKRRMRVE